MATSHRYTVVAGVDFSSVGRIALDQAIGIVERTPDAELHVCTTLEPTGAPLGLEYSDDIERAKAFDETRDRLTTYVLERFEAVATRGDHGRLVAHLAEGKPAQQLVQLASDLHADLIVVGTHGRQGVKRLLLGSVAEAIVRTAPCPVLVARDKDTSGGIPEIEPPCPRCADARMASGGAELWCAQHQERHGRRHTYFSRDRAAESRRGAFGGGAR